MDFKKGMLDTAYIYRQWNEEMEETLSTPSRRHFESSDLRARFEEKYHDQIQELYESFIRHEVAERLIAKYPVLGKDIMETSLPARAKNFFRQAWINTVLQVGMYSFDELMSFRSLGRKTVMEIDKFFVENGITDGKSE